MKVRVDVEQCQGHGRCYTTAPEVFAPDELGNGREIDDGSVPPEFERQARIAVANCPERAITAEDEG